MASSHRARFADLVTAAGSTTPGGQSNPCAAKDARFNFPAAVVCEGGDSPRYFIVDTGNNCIREVSHDGKVRVYAGKCGEDHGGYKDAQQRINALFNRPEGMCVEPASGDIFIADTENHCVRRICSGTGEVKTVAGKGGQAGFVDGTSADAMFNRPSGLALDVISQKLYVADTMNHRIRVISLKKGDSVSSVAGCGEPGLRTGRGIAAALHCPCSLDCDENGNVYIADRGNHCIRLLARDGELLVVAGSGMPGYVDGFASRAMFNEPCGVMCGEHGEVYVCDGANRRIRVIVDGSSVTTVAGCGERGVLDNEPLSASFCRPVSCSLDRTGAILICDEGGHCIRHLKKRRRVQWGEDDAEDGTELQIEGAVAPRGNPGGRKDVNALLDELRKIVEAVPDSSNTVEVFKWRSGAMEIIEGVRTIAKADFDAKKSAADHAETAELQKQQAERKIVELRKEYVMLEKNLAVSQRDVASSEQREGGERKRRQAAEAREMRAREERDVSVREADDARRGREVAEARISDLEAALEALELQRQQDTWAVQIAEVEANRERMRRRNAQARVKEERERRRASEVEAGHERAWRMMLDTAIAEQRSRRKTAELWVKDGELLLEEAESRALQAERPQLLTAALRRLKTSLAKDPEDELPGQF